MAKGQADFIIILIFITVIGIVVLLTYSILGSMITSGGLTGIDTAGMIAAQQGVQVWDGGMVFFVIFMGIISVISGLLIRTHPVFFIIMILFFGIVGVLSPTFSNIYDTFATGLGPETDAAFGNMGFMIRNISFFLIAIMTVTAVVTYSKTREVGW